MLVWFSKICMVWYEYADLLGAGKHQNRCEKPSWEQEDYDFIYCKWSNDQMQLLLFLFVGISVSAPGWAWRCSFLFAGIWLQVRAQVAHLYEGPLCHLEGRELSLNIRIVTLQVHHNMGVKDAKADRCCMFCFLNLFVETPKSEIFAYTFQSNEYCWFQALVWSFRKASRRRSLCFPLWPYG